MTLDEIPPYDPTAEKRKKPKTGEIVSEGVWVGRPSGDKQLVDPKLIWILAEMGSPDREIATRLGIDESSLRFNFASFMAKARSNLNIKLRRAQIQTALNGNPTMLVWLGKQLLGQSDQPIDTETTQILPWTKEE